MDKEEQEQSVTSDNSVTSLAGNGFNSRIRLHDHLKKNEFMAASSRFKGVSCQNNGHWGAQIYVNQQILVMIKDGSYINKFSEPESNPVVGMMGQELFQKELTPSDVGKLNRLVIPRKFAVKYFPSICKNPPEKNGDVVPGVEDTDLYFYDRSRRSWKFRYCYWRSSQSFVFTRGWNRFVKEKGLKSKDVVVFSFLEDNHMIDVIYTDAARNNVADDDASGLGIEATKVSNGVVDSFTEEDIQMGEVEEDNIFGQTIDFFANETMIKKQKGLRLFGVQIV
ncbi:DNA-binding transcription factor [Lithospermum erythrorhizon]|uniref:DNA-binding transcription factor n=1 Tax=Lithospermum erythrorhizon TaxID=34254 RepID=A0AAV3NUL7_LITER